MNEMQIKKIAETKRKKWQKKMVAEKTKTRKITSKKVEAIMEVSEASCSSFA